MPALRTTVDREGVRVATSRMMATNVTVLSAGGESLLVDAPYFPDELAELAGWVGAGDVRLFATHSHFDHLLARYAFPAATLVIGRATAEALADDPARPASDLLAEDSRTYVRRERPLLFGALQGVPVPGWLEVGPHDAELVPAPGHTADGTALWAPWAGVLCCGDYLSDVEIPLLSAAGSLEDYRATLERLVPYVEQATLLVPGHGTPCDARQARRRLEADLRYLETLVAADPDQALPAGRDTPRQREIHRANLERHGPAAEPPDAGEAGAAPAREAPAREAAADPPATAPEDDSPGVRAVERSTRRRRR